MILGGTPSAPALSLSGAAAVFSRLHGVRIVKRPASSTGKSRARQGAGPARGQWFRPDSRPIVHRPTRVLDPPAMVRETAEAGIHTEAQREKYETNPISHKPIAINGLRLVLSAAGKIAKGDILIHGQSQYGIGHRPRHLDTRALLDERGPRTTHLSSPSILPLSEDPLAVGARPLPVGTNTPVCPSRRQAALTTFEPRSGAGI